MFCLSPTRSQSYEDPEQEGLNNQTNKTKVFLWGHTFSVKLLCRRQTLASISCWRWLRESGSAPVSLWYPADYHRERQETDRRDRQKDEWLMNPQTSRALWKFTFLSSSNAFELFYELKFVKRRTSDEWTAPFYTQSHSWKTPSWEYIKKPRDSSHNNLFFFKNLSCFQMLSR